MLLAQAKHRLGTTERLARFIPDRCDQARITRAISDMIRAHILAIACGYEDRNDFGPLRTIRPSANELSAVGSGIVAW